MSLENIDEKMQKAITNLEDNYAEIRAGNGSGDRRERS